MYVSICCFQKKKPKKQTPFISLLILLIAGSLCLFHTTIALEDTYKMWNMATRHSLGTAMVRHSHCCSFGMSHHSLWPHLTVDVKFLMSFSVTWWTHHLVLLWMFTKLSFLVLGGRVSLSFTSLQLFGVYSKVLKNFFFVTSDILVFIFHYSGLRSFAFFLLLFTDYLFL